MAVGYFSLFEILVAFLMFVPGQDYLVALVPVRNLVAFAFGKLGFFRKIWTFFEKPFLRPRLFRVSVEIICPYIWRANPARNHDHVRKQVLDPLVQSNQVFKPN